METFKQGRDHSKSSPKEIDDCYDSDAEISSFNEDLIKQIAVKDQTIKDLREKLISRDSEWADKYTGQQATIDSLEKMVSETEGIHARLWDACVQLVGLVNSKNAFDGFEVMHMEDLVHELEESKKAYEMLEEKYDFAEDLIVLADMESDKLREQLSRHFIMDCEARDVQIKKDKIDTVKEFKHLWESTGARGMPREVQLLTTDFITNVFMPITCEACAAEIRRPLTISQVAYSMGYNDFLIDDLQTIGNIASDTYLRINGHRPPKRLQCSGGNYLLVNSYTTDERTLIEDAIETFVMSRFG